MMRVVIRKPNVAPKAKDIPMELHHRALLQRLKTSKANELWNPIPTTPWGHTSMDSYRYIEYELKKILKGVSVW